MNLIFLHIWFFLSFPIVAVLSYYLYRFARIILLFEEDISNSIEALNDVEDSMGKVIGLKLFFDNDTVKNIVKEVMGEVKLAKEAINKQAKALIERSKQKYIIVEDLESEPTEINRQPQEQEERTVFHVGRGS